MVKKISRCSICGEFFQSRKELKGHKNKDHRITAPKIVAGITKDASLSSSKKGSIIWSENDEIE